LKAFKPRLSIPYHINTACFSGPEGGAIGAALAGIAKMYILRRLSGVPEPL